MYKKRRPPSVMHTARRSCEQEDKCGQDYSHEGDSRHYDRCHHSPEGHELLEARTCTISLEPSHEDENIQSHLNKSAYDVKLNKDVCEVGDKEERKPEES